MAPHFQRSEEYIIGAIACYPELYHMCSGIKEADFYDGKCKAAWQAIEKISSKGGTPDTVSLLSHVDDPSWLSKCSSGVTTKEFFQGHLRAIQAASARRSLLAISGKIEQLAMDDSLDTAQAISAAQDLVDGCQDHSEDFVRIDEVAKVVYSEMEDRANGVVNDVFAIPTGIRTLDERALSFSGFPCGHVTVIAAEPNEGKTAAAQTCGIHAARLGHPVLYLTVEDNARSGTTRRISQLSGIENRQLQKRIVSENEWGKVRSAISKLDNVPFYFYDKYAESVDKLCMVANSAVRKLGIKLAVFDYLQLIPSGKTLNDKQEVDYVLRKIQQFTKRNPSVATVLVSQFRRKEGNEPTMHDLYLSGRIEQETHTIILIWDPKPTDWPKIRPNPLGGVNHLDCRIFKVAKQKDGPKESYAIGWDPRRVTFYHDESLQREYKLALTRKDI